MPLEPWRGEGLFEYNTKYGGHRKQRLVNKNI